MTTVTLDPRHSHRKTKEFVYGTDNGMLLLSSKGWLGNTETMLFQGRGKVHVAKMAGTLLAWATDSGLRVYNTADHSRIGKIDRPASPTTANTTPTTSSNTKNNENSGGGGNSGSGSSCSLMWVGDRELLVGWGRHVLVLAIIPIHTSTPTGSSATVPPSSTETAVLLQTPPRREHQQQGPSPSASTFSSSTAAAGTTPPPPPSATSAMSSRQFTLHVVSEFEIVEREEEVLEIVVVGVAPFGRHLAVLLNSCSKTRPTSAGGGGGGSDFSNNFSSTKFKVFDRLGNELFTDLILENDTTTSSSTTSSKAPLLGFASFYSVDDILNETTSSRSSPIRPGAAVLDTTPSSSTNTENMNNEEYRWWSNGAEPVYFIISPKSITLGRPRSTADRISWLVQRKRYYEAVQLAESDSSIQPDVKVQLGEQYLHYLIGTEIVGTNIETPRSSRTPHTAAADGDTNTSRITTINTTDEHPPRNDNVSMLVISIENYKNAAAMCPRLLGKDAAAWERWVYIFGQAAQLPLLAPNVPTSDPVLSRDAYDMILSACLRGGGGTSNVVHAAHDMLRDLVERWPHGIYDARALIQQIQPRLEQQRPTSASATSTLSSSSSPALKRTAAFLYAQLGQHDAVLRLLLELRSPSIFEYIKTNALHAFAANFAAELIELDEVKATQMFVDAVEEAPAAAVVASLQSKITSRSSDNDVEIWSLRLFHYVDWLWQKEVAPGGSHNDFSSSSSSSFSSSSLSQLHIELCATHDPHRLMHILTTSSLYPLDAALQVCESRNLVRESVYLLGRMGSSDAALRLIITKLRDVEGAVTFVQDSSIAQDDSSLWELLISLTLGDAALTGALLDHAPAGARGGGGGCIDPLRLVEAIPRDIKIERLRDRLVRVITDFKATVSLQSGCNAVLRTDCLELGDKLYRELTRALKTLFIRKPGGSTWVNSASSSISSNIQRNGGESAAKNDDISVSEESGGSFSAQLPSGTAESTTTVWIGKTSTPTSTRKMSMTPPPSVHTSPSKFPPSKNKNNTSPKQQHRTVNVL